MSTPPPPDEGPSPDDDEVWSSKPIAVGPRPGQEQPDGGSPPGYATEVVQVDDDDS